MRHRDFVALYQNYAKRPVAELPRLPGMVTAKELTDGQA
jgi:hypothetical protein